MKTNRPNSSVAERLPDPGDVYLIRLMAPDLHYHREAYPQPFHLLMLVVEGSGVHTIDEQMYALESGQLYHVRPGQVHGWTLSDDTRAYLLFIRPTCRSMVGFPGGRSGPPTMCQMGFRLAILAKLFEQLHAHFLAERARQPAQFHARLTALLGCLVPLLTPDVS